MAIVEAVAVSASSRSPGRKLRAKAIEAAMRKAVEKAYSKGITDPNVIREMMQNARQTVKE